MSLQLNYIDSLKKGDVNKLAQNYKIKGYLKMSRTELIDKIEDDFNPSRDQIDKIIKPKKRTAETSSNIQLEEIYKAYLPKYALVEFVKENYADKDLPDKFNRILTKNKNELIEWIFDNIPLKELPENIEYFDKFPRPSNLPKQIASKSGIDILTDEEARDLMERQDYSHIYEGKNPIGKQSGKQVIKLQEHQKDFLNGYFLGNQRSAILFHGVGTGKTLSAVASAKLYLQLFPKGQVIIITPPAVLFNFVDSMALYGVNPQDPRYKFYSFDKYSKQKKNLGENALVIIDEAHNLRTEILGVMTEEIKNGLPRFEVNVVKGKRPANIIDKTIQAKKIILLTATPFVNEPYDIENLMAIGDSRPPLDKSNFGPHISSQNFRMDYFKYRISKYDREFKKGDFPEMREEFIPLVIDPKENKLISALPSFSIGGTETFNIGGMEMKNPFYSVSRQESLKHDGMKFDYIEKKISKEPTKKYVVYSAYLFHGINKIKQRLESKGISVGLITGQIPTKRKALMIDGYNNFNNPNYNIQKYQVLLISKSGSEGVNLLETRGIFVIDGVWNEALYEQIVARAVRFRSHKALPENEQYVNIYKLFLCFPYEKPIIDKLNKGGKFDYERFIATFKAKKKAIKQATVGLEKTESSNAELVQQVKDKDMPEKVLVNFGNDNPDFSKAELKKFKKGSKERLEYLEKNMTFGKNKAKYELQGVISKLLQNIPSTDFYMFMLQKTKQNKINQLLKSLKTIPKTEQTIEEIPEAKKLMKEINEIMTNQKLQLKEKNIIDMLISSFREDATKAIKKIGKQLERKKGLVDDLIQKQAVLKQMRRDKSKARINQEFFTPDAQVKKLITLSGIEDRDKFVGLNILEPSAGWGNIVRSLLETCSKKKYNAHIDMVEFMEDNRKNLKEIQDLVPENVSLQAEPNFLKYLTSKRYDYIFMNPPFYLQRRLNKFTYTKDIYDYNFIMRAYALLELNGVLVAITGMKWKDSKEAKEFYKKIEAHTEEETVKWTGAEVKAGGEVQALKITRIYIKKLKDDKDFDNKLLKENGEDLIFDPVKSLPKPEPEPEDNFGKVESVTHETQPEPTPEDPDAYLFKDYDDEGKEILTKEEFNKRIDEIYEKYPYPKYRRGEAGKRIEEFKKTVSIKKEEYTPPKKQTATPEENKKLKNLLRNVKKIQAEGKHTILKIPRQKLIDNEEFLTKMEKMNTNLTKEESQDLYDLVNKDIEGVGLFSIEKYKRDLEPKIGKKKMKEKIKDAIELQKTMQKEMKEEPKKLSAEQKRDIKYYEGLIQNSKDELPKKIKKFNTGLKKLENRLKKKNFDKSDYMRVYSDFGVRLSSGASFEKYKKAVPQVLKKFNKTQKEFDNLLESLLKKEIKEDKEEGIKNIEKRSNETIDSYNKKIKEIKDKVGTIKDVTLKEFKKRENQLEAEINKKRENETVRRAKETLQEARARVYNNDDEDDKQFEMNRNYRYMEGALQQIQRLPNKDDETDEQAEAREKKTREDKQIEDIKGGTLNLSKVWSDPNYADLVKKHNPSLSTMVDKIVRQMKGKK